MDGIGSRVIVVCWGGGETKTDMVMVVVVVMSVRGIWEGRRERERIKEGRWKCE